MKVVIAGGGTGGHIYIGVALARELQRRDAAAEVVFIGTRRGLESRIVPQEGFQLEFIESAGLKRVGIWNLARNLALVPRSMTQSRKLLTQHRPAVVVGVGGYSSGPVVLAARFQRIPTMVVEPNAYPGLTNRLLSRLVDRAALAFPEARRHFGKGGVLTGIPVRREFQQVPRRVRSNELALLVYGGSQGSHALNSVVCRTLPLLKADTGIWWTHQTGEREFEEVRRAYRDAGIDGDVRPFLPRIYDDFARADLIICRAGAGTVAELTVAGKAALLVPFPGATDDHQTRNARSLQAAGAARLLPEAELTPERLVGEIRAFKDHPEELNRMEEAARRAAKPDAAERIVDVIYELAS